MNPCQELHQPSVFTVINGGGAGARSLSGQHKRIKEGVPQRVAMMHAGVRLGWYSLHHSRYAYNVSIGVGLNRQRLLTISSHTVETSNCSGIWTIGRQCANAAMIERQPAASDQEREGGVGF